MGGGEKGCRKQHLAGKMTAREAALRCLMKSFVETGLFVKAPLYEFRHGEEAVPGRGRCDRLWDREWETYIRCGPGFYRDRRFSGGNACGQDCKDAGGAMKAGAPMICINDSGERAFRKAWMHWRDMGASFITIPWLRGDPTDIRDYGAMRGRRCIFAGPDRFYLHGKEYKPDVYNRASVIAAVTGESVTAEETGGSEDP